jgi:hypothetical protein
MRLYLLLAVAAAASPLPAPQTLEPPDATGTGTTTPLASAPRITSRTSVSHATGTTHPTPASTDRESAAMSGAVRSGMIFGILVGVAIFAAIGMAYFLRHQSVRTSPAWLTPAQAPTAAAPHPHLHVDQKQQLRGRVRAAGVFARGRAGLTGHPGGWWPASVYRDWPPCVAACGRWRPCWETGCCSRSWQYVGGREWICGMDLMNFGQCFWNVVSFEAPFETHSN